jgi:hypothetical protein
MNPEFLSFEMRVQLAIGEALRKDLGAKLQEVIMLSDYSTMRCTFSGNDPQHSLSVSVDTEGNVKGPVKMTWPWNNSEGMLFPIGMDYNSARLLFDDYLPRVAWSHVVLRRPFGGPTDSLEFTFSTGKGLVVVDTTTGKVYTKS